MANRKPVQLDPRIDWFSDVRVILSPMSGVTDRAFRDICRDHGVDLAFCEFTAAKGLTYDNPQTWRLIDTEGENGRVGVQIFGNEPEAMAWAARLLGGRRLDVLDINFGCPAKKVVRKSGGSALLADLPLLQQIVTAVVAASPVPVAAKIRTGWDAASVNYREVGLMLQDAGCVWVTLHGRTRAQRFTGRADWDTIADLVEILDIPVVGNGDVIDLESYLAMVRHTRCHAVMIGRGAIGNPWLFAAVAAHHAGCRFTPPTLDDILAVIERHVRELARWRGERTAAHLVRKHVVRYLRGFPGAASLRKRLFALDDAAAVQQELARLRRDDSAVVLVTERERWVG